MNEAEELFIKWMSEVKSVNEPNDMYQHMQENTYVFSQEENAYSFSQDAFLAGFKAGYEFKLKYNAEEQLQK